MEITEVRIKLMEDSDDRLQAFCSITFDDCFVVRDLKIIEGTNGAFVAMPSRKLTSHCQNCGTKNHLRASYCNNCGAKQRGERSFDHEGRTKLYADIAHPINSDCREMIQTRVVAEYRLEQERAQQPGYTSRYDDDYDADLEVREARDVELNDPQQHAQIQPAEPEVRPPHRPKETEKAAETSATSKPDDGNDGFGAGIF